MGKQATDWPRIIRAEHLWEAAPSRLEGTEVEFRMPPYWLGKEDSNLSYLVQSQASYH
jgi:hypothetical protein